MLKTYQFKTHCKGDSHSSETANIKRNGIQIHSTALCWLKRLLSPKLNTIFRLRRNLCFITSRGEMIFPTAWPFSVITPKLLLQNKFLALVVPNLNRPG